MPIKGIILILLAIVIVAIVFREELYDIWCSIFHNNDKE